MSIYQGAPVEHAVVDGMAIYEGDILLGPASAMSPVPAGSKRSGRSAVTITGARYRWPNGTMPYVIASNIPNPERITKAIHHWNTVMAGTVQMVPRTTESNYVFSSYPVLPGHARPTWECWAMAASRSVSAVTAARET